MTHSGRDVDGLDPGTGLLLPLVRDRVGDDELLELGAVEGLDSVAAQDAVRYYSNGGFGAVGHDDVGGLAEGAAGVGHVVNDDCDLAGDVAHEDHSRDLVGAGALLVDEGEA